MNFWQSKAYMEPYQAISTSKAQWFHRQ